MTPMEGAAIVAGVTASGLPFALAACHLAARTARRSPTGRRARAQDDRDLMRLARNTERNYAAMHADRAAILAATEDDPRRSPNWCWTHDCPMGQCPPQPDPQQGGH